MLPLIEGVTNRPEHFHLLRTVFKAFDILRECPTRFNDRSELIDIDRLKLRIRLKRLGAYRFAKLKEQAAFFVEDAFGLDALLDHVLQDPAERQLCRPG